jgi:hypothetical protein
MADASGNLGKPPDNATKLVSPSSHCESGMMMPKRAQHCRNDNDMSNIGPVGFARLLLRASLDDCLCWSLVGQLVATVTWVGCHLVVAIPNLVGFV